MVESSRGRPVLFKGDSQKLLRPTPVAMVTNICKFQHKNGYNSGCVRHIRGYSESTHLRVSDKFAQTDLVAMVTINRELKHKIGYNSPYVSDITHIRASSTGFWGRPTKRWQS